MRPSLFLVAAILASTALSTAALASPCTDLDGATMAGGVVRLAQDIDANATLQVSGQPHHQRPSAALTRTARKSLTLVSVGPVTTWSPSA
jgi:hypothetical protein